MLHLRPLRPVGENVIEIQTCQKGTDFDSVSPDAPDLFVAPRKDGSLDLKVGLRDFEGERILRFAGVQPDVVAHSSAGTLTYDLELTRPQFPVCVFVVQQHHSLRDVVRQLAAVAGVTVEGVELIPKSLSVGLDLPELAVDSVLQVIGNSALLTVDQLGETRFRLRKPDAGGKWRYLDEHVRSLERVSDEDAAVPVAESMLALAERDPGPDSRRLVSSLIALAHLSRIRGDATRAVQLTDRALGIAQKSLRPGDLALADVYQLLGDLRRDQKRDTEAFAAYERALHICESSPQPNYIQIGSVATNMALIRKGAGDLTPAESLFVRSNTAFEKSKVVGTDYRPTALTMLNYMSLEMIYRESARTQPADSAHAHIEQLKKLLGVGER